MFHSYVLLSIRRGESMHTYRHAGMQAFRHGSIEYTRHSLNFRHALKPRFKL